LQLKSFPSEDEELEKQVMSTRFARAAPRRRKPHWDLFLYYLSLVNAYFPVQNFGRIRLTTLAVGVPAVDQAINDPSFSTYKKSSSH